MNIEGLDISHWSGTNIDWNKMKNAGIQFIYIKCSQGTTIKDPRYDINIENAKSVGIKVGAYHFTTDAEPVAQYEWFMKCMGNWKFDLTPALDCEAYYYGETEAFSIREFRYREWERFSAMSYSITTEAIVDIMGMNIAGYQGFPLPAIYTNKYSGDIIFHTSTMKKYPLWIAHWDVETPSLPNVWKGEPYYVWQDGIYLGANYGIYENNVDHDIWGNKMVFPGSDENVIYFPIIIKDAETKEFLITVERDNVRYAGKKKLEKK